MTTYVLRSTRSGRGTLDLLGQLNEQQRAVVLAPPGQTLVIAGAGSGKTRTLIYRAACLLSAGVAQERMLLCTFTNRAAREMTRRMEALLDCDLRGLWAGTFHHVANLALRKYGERVGLPEGYSILDREDARDLMTACLAEEGPLLRTKRFPKPNLLLHLCSRVVDLQRPLVEVIQSQAPRFIDAIDDIARMLERFAKKKLRLGLLDYDDLLLFFRRLLVEDQSARIELSERFEHVLVDEYQDTSQIQGEIVDLCASGHRNLTAVGDDAQSIYSFRGADFRNIIDFPKRYPEARVFKLETNYRSSPEILRLANASIAVNRTQYPKVLQAVKSAGMVPPLIPLKDVYQQAEFVAQRVLELHQEEAVPLSNIAVLYRAHAHSLELQVELTRRQIPFVVRSGLRFFEQAHIKDVMAYLRVLQNSADQLAWHRILKLWPGVGAKSTAHVLQAVEQDPKAQPAARVLGTVQHALPKSAQPSVQRLGQMLGRLQELSGDGAIAKAIEALVAGHYGDYARSTFSNADTRLDDVKQFADYASRYDQLETLLSDLALVSGMTAEGAGPGDPPEECMTLSTVHQAKGLEWRVVFVLWLADGRFPSAIALRTPEEEEEERRLFHVAVTRAEEQLYLCHPRYDESHEGPRRMLRVSRFLSEVGSPASLPYERWEIEEQPA